MLALGALAREASAIPAAWVDALAHALCQPAAWPDRGGRCRSPRPRRHLARTALRTMIAAQVQNVATIGLILVALSFLAPHLIPAGLANAKGGDERRRAQIKPAAPAMERKPSRPAPAPAPPTFPQKTPQAKSITVRGRVLDPDGKPFEGAKILLVSGGLKKPANPPVRNQRPRRPVPVRHCLRRIRREHGRDAMERRRGHGPRRGIRFRSGELSGRQR